MHVTIRDRFGGVSERLCDGLCCEPLFGQSAREGVAECSELASHCKARAFVRFPDPGLEALVGEGLATPREEHTVFTVDTPEFPAFLEHLTGHAVQPDLALNPGFCGIYTILILVASTALVS